MHESMPSQTRKKGQAQCPKLCFTKSPSSRRFQTMGQEQTTGSESEGPAPASTMSSPNVVSNKHKLAGLDGDLHPNICQLIERKCLDQLGGLRPTTSTTSLTMLTTMTVIQVSANRGFQIVVRYCGLSRDLNEETRDETEAD